MTATTGVAGAPPVDPASRDDLAVCVDVLGRLRLRIRGRRTEVPGPRRRALLALLALAGDRGASLGTIIDALWADGPPANAAQAVYNHVSRLRGHLASESGRLERSPAGYRLRLAPYELDADAARRWADHDPAAALALWRGPALAEFRTVPALAATAVGLDELRLRLEDDAIEARLDAGDRSVVGRAAAVAAAHPLRERTAMLHVRALAADTRAGEALAAAQAFRRRLAEETGLDPSPGWAALEQRIAVGDGSPGTPPPPPDGPMLGRQQDRDEVLRLLTDHAVVTVTGPGGVGKTRLALDIAADPGTGREAALVPLAVVDRPEHVWRAVATGVGLRASSDLAARDVALALADRRLLLVLDNCEHVVDECRELVQRLRGSAPGVQVLATSRTTLQAPDEYVLRLRPLPVPRDTTDLAAVRRSPSVRAFVEHARRRRADVELADEDVDDLVAVLRRLDGLPLGIELAARQVAVMPLADVRRRLDRALDLSTGHHAAGEERRVTLRATIDSSYRLLGTEAQRLLRRLAPFIGGVDLTTVEELAVGLSADPLDLLHELVDASLLVAEPVVGRYHLLFTVRTFLLEELDRLDERQEAVGRFVARCRSVAEEVRTAMFGPDEAATDRRLRLELDNLRAARDHAGLDDTVAITLAVESVATWRDLHEAWAWASELAQEPALENHPARRAVLAGAAEAARLVGDFAGARRWARTVLELSPEGPDSAALRAWSVLAVVDHFDGAFDLAREEWLRAAAGPTPDRSSFLGSAALAAGYAGRRDEAHRLLEEARALATCGSHRAFAAYVEGELLAPTDPAAAVPRYEAAIAEAGEVGCTFIEGVASVSLALARARTGDRTGAADGYLGLLALWRRTGQSTQLWTTARNAAELLAGAGRTRAAVLLLLASDAQRGAATVDERIARHSTRSHLDPADLVDAAALADLRAEVRRLRATEVLDTAAAELRGLAARDTPTAGLSGSS